MIPAAYALCDPIWQVALRTS